MSAPSTSPRDLVRAPHKKAARMVGIALTIHEREAYAVLARGLAGTLTPEERHGLAWAALHACEPHKAWAVAANRFERQWQDGPADAPWWLFDMDPAQVMDQAMLWARDATEFQRRACAMAALAHMPEEERHAIVRALSAREAS